jgi:pimeloyl-ACP methyl ester carboxylesterase
MRVSRSNVPHVVGLSMGGYAALQFGLRYPEEASAIAAAVGSGSLPSQRDAWLKETSVLSRIFIVHGMRAMAKRMARGPTRIQLECARSLSADRSSDRLWNLTDGSRSGIRGAGSASTYVAWKISCWKQTAVRSWAPDIPTNKISLSALASTAVLLMQVVPPLLIGFP